MNKFERWLEDFKQTPEYFADTFTWGDMAKAAYNAGEEGADKGTLRDRFAMAALTGIASSGSNDTWDGDAESSYKWADAMMRMRDISRDSGNTSD
jgi:hypothetical protein